MTLTRPSPGDPLSSSNGKSSTQILDEYADAIEVVQDSVTGPVFTSVESASPIISETLLLDPETTTGWVGVGVTPALDVLHTLSTRSVKFTPIGICWDNNPMATNKGYYNVPVPWVRGSHMQFAFDFRWARPGTTSTNPPQPTDVMEIVVSDAADLGGNVVTYQLDPLLVVNTFTTLYVNVAPLTQIGSFGFRTKNIYTNEAGASLAFYFDNIRWGTQTELESTLATSESAIISPTYTPTGTQQSFAPDVTESVIDLRPNNLNIANYGGIRNVRDFQPPFVEDGSQDATLWLTTILAQLRPGDMLQFPPTAVYRFDLNQQVEIRYLKDVTLDGRGCRLYTTIARNKPFFTPTGCKNLTIRGFRMFGAYPQTFLGNTFVPLVGTPTIVGSNYTLTTQDDELRAPVQTLWARDKDGVGIFNITLSDTTHVANDCVVSLVDIESPKTKVTATAVGGPTNSVEPGTRYYAVSFVDEDDRETGIGVSTRYTNASWSQVALSAIPVGALVPPVYQRNIWRTDAGATDDPRNYYHVGTIPDNTTTTFTDTASDASSGPTLSPALAGTVGAAGNVDAGTHIYVTSRVNSAGNETLIQQTGRLSLTLTTGSQVNLTNVGVGTTFQSLPITKRRIWRTKANRTSGMGNFYLVGEIADNTTTTFTDNIADASLGVVGPDQAKGVKPAMLAQRTFTLTSTPTSYAFTWDGKNLLDDEVWLKVRKSSASANTITVGTLTTTGSIRYDAAVEGGHGIQLGHSNNGILIEDCFFERMTGDAITSSQNDLSNITIRRCVGRGSGRQGMSFNGGRHWLIEDCTITECPRSGIDLEPETELNFMEDVVIRRINFRWIGNAAIAMTQASFMRHVDISDITVRGSAQWGILGGAENLTLRDIKMPWAPMELTMARNLTLDGIICRDITSTANIYRGWAQWPAEGARITNVRLTDYQANRKLSLMAPKASITNVSAQRSLSRDPFVDGAAGPFQLATDAVWALLDPGIYRETFPGTFKGIGAGSLHFPRGLDVKDEPLLQTRSLSGSTTRGNNLRGIGVAVTAGSTTATVPFPARTYTNPTSFNLSSLTGGTLSLTTYYYRVAARMTMGGPLVALAEKSRTLTGSSTAMGITIIGLRQPPYLLEGFTVYRGTSPGVYTARYDLVANQDWHGLGAATDQHLISDLGTTINLIDGSSVPAWGYPNPLSQTSTTSHPSWTGSAWTVQDETGYEPDATYAIMLETSWQTTWRASAKRMNGFDLEFGTAVPVGGGTLSWFLVR